MILHHATPTSVPNAPVRRMTQNDRSVLNAASCSQDTLQLDDKVSLADPKAVFLTGLVAYIGNVSFAQGTWVGIQLTGPSVGKGNCNGTYKGKVYFANVGKNNGMLAPIDVVNQYCPETDQNLEDVQTKAMVTVDVLTNARAASILRADKKVQRRPKYKEEIYIRRLKESSLGQAIGDRKPDFRSSSKLKYAKPDSTLCDDDLRLAIGLDKTHQNFCLSDPTMHDNPITYASQAFLDLTGYRLSEILGRNCRFLQGADTDKEHVDRIRQSIVEGADCHVCLLNYRKDGSPFYNRLFMTALRDHKGRVKNFLGVQCEVSKETAMKINEQEMSLFKAGMRRAGTHFTKRPERTVTEPSISSTNSEEEPSEAMVGASENPVFDIDEAMFRLSLEDPFGELSNEDIAWYKKLKSDPFSGYSTLDLMKGIQDERLSKETDSAIEAKAIKDEKPSDEVNASIESKEIEEEKEMKEMNIAMGDHLTDGASLVSDDTQTTPTRVGSYHPKDFRTIEREKQMDKIDRAMEETMKQSA